MEKNCLYCNRPFSTNRGSKKYCTDNCKQLAYLQRCGMVRSTERGLDNLNYPSSNKSAIPFGVNDVRSVVDVKDVNHVKHVKDVKQENGVNDTSAEIISTQTLNKLVEKITEAHEIKLAKAIDRIREELSQNRDAKIIPFETGKNCKPCLTDIFRYRNDLYFPKADTEKQDAKLIRFGFNEPQLLQVENHKEIIGEGKSSVKTDATPPKRNSNEELQDHEHDSDEQDDTTINYEMPEKMYCMDFPQDDEKEEPYGDAITMEQLREEIRKPENPADNAINNEPESKNEGDYEWVESKFLRRIEKQYSADGVELKFRHPYSHWDNMDAQSVAWVNIRLRCLIENLIRVSNLCFINRESFYLLADAFISLVKSPTYENLPENYPYTEIVNDLAIKLHRMKKDRLADEIKIQLPFQRKVALIVVRQQLLNSTVPVRFADLHFLDARLYCEQPDTDSSEKSGEENAKPKDERAKTETSSQPDELKKAS